MGMLNRKARALLGLALAVLLDSCFAMAQTPDTPRANLKEMHADGMKSLPEAQVLTFTGLQTGAQVSKNDLQAGSDRLVATGLFADVRYEYRTRGEDLTAVFHVQESPRIPVYFDNFATIGDSELMDAIRKRIPFFDGTLPEAGFAVDQAADSVKELVAARGLQAAIEHQVMASPLGDGNVQEFRIDGATLQISTIEFSDPALSASRAAQQHLSEIVGKPYSRLAIDVFLSEQIRPVYLKQGYLRVKLGPPGVRLTGNPSQKLPEQIPVFVPVSTGPLYRFKGADWSGNNMLSTITLTQLLGISAGDVANGMTIEAGWDRIREEYGRLGYLEAALTTATSYDETAHTVAYSVNISEGAPFTFGEMVLTGISASAEKRLRDAWPVAPGASFDKAKFEDFLTKLQTHRDRIFGDLPVHYEEVGHWLKTDSSKGTVDILLDFK